MYRFVSASSGSLEYGYAIIINADNKCGRPINENAHILLENIDTGRQLHVTNDKFRKLIDMNDVAGLETEGEMQVVCALSQRSALLWNQVIYNEIITVNTAIFNYRGRQGYDKFIDYLSNASHLSSLNGFTEGCARHKMICWKQVHDALGGIGRDGLYFHDMYTSTPSCAGTNIIDLYFLMPESFYIMGDLLMLHIPEQAVHDYSPIYTWKLGYKFLIEVL